MTPAYTEAPEPSVPGLLIFQVVDNVHIYPYTKQVIGFIEREIYHEAGSLL